MPKIEEIDGISVMRENSGKWSAWFMLSKHNMSKVITRDTKDQAIEVAKRLRRRLRNTPLYFGGWSVKIGKEMLVDSYGGVKSTLVKGPCLEFSSDVDGMSLSIEEAEEFVKDLAKMIQEAKNV